MSESQGTIDLVPDTRETTVSRDQETKEELRQQLSDVLRAEVGVGALEPEQARRIYAAMYGVYETDCEFGPEVPKTPQGKHEAVPV